MFFYLFIEQNKFFFLSPGGNNRSSLDCSDDLIELSEKNHSVVKDL